jgi:hypothetical protein
MNNLMANFSCLHFDTEYSGMDYPWLCMEFIRESARRRGFYLGRPSYHAACDVSSAAKTVLTFEPHFPEHTFNDMFDRLPDGVNARCEQEAPYDTLRQTNPALSAEQFRRIKEIQDAYYDSPAFNWDVRCRCSSPGHAMCKVYSLGKEGDLRVTAAGLECIDWSPFGSQEQAAGPSMRKMFLWIADRKKCQEDLIIAECWRDFPHWVIAEDQRYHMV